MEYNVQHWADTRSIERISCSNKDAQSDTLEVARPARTVLRPKPRSTWAQCTIKEYSRSLPTLTELRLHSPGTGAMNFANFKVCRDSCTLSP